MRRPGEAQSWLASGGIELDEQVQNWLEEEIIALDGERVRRLEVSPPSGDGYAVVRDAPAGELRLDGLADGEKLKQDANLNQLLGALARVQLEDIRPLGEVDWPDEQHTVRVATFDGLELTLQLATVNDQHWLRVDAAGAAPDQPQGEQPPVEGQVEEQAGQQTAEQPQAGQTAVEGEAEKSAGEQAEVIKARTDGWAYQVSDYLFGRLTKPRADWIEDAGTS
jgi:Domain of unknown function (DUF4340)